MKSVKVEERETERVVSKKDREITELSLATTMEAYRDSLLPELLPPVTTSVYENRSNSRKCLKKPKPKPIDVVQRDRHRREKMTGMFSVLRSIVPNLLPKAKKEQIVAETVQFIRCLEEEKERLERIKKSRLPEPAVTVTAGYNSAVNVTVAGEGVVFFGIELMFRPGLAAEVFAVFERCGTEVLAGTATVNGGQEVLSVTVTVVVGGDVEEEIEKIKAEILEL